MIFTNKKYPNIKLQKNGQGKRWKKHREKRAQRKKQHGEMTGDIADADIITVHHLKKRR